MTTKSKTLELPKYMERHEQLSLLGEAPIVRYVCLKCPRQFKTLSRACGHRKVHG